MAVGAVAGTKIYIAPTGATPSPDTYVEIKNIANLGEVSSMFSKIAVESVGDGYTRQIKGTQSSPAFTLELNRDDTDPGQIAVKAAFAVRNSLYNFKVVENDIVITATTVTFTGRVYNSGSQYGAVNALKKTKVDIEIEPDSIVVVAGT